MFNNSPSLIGKNIKCSCKGYNLDKLLQPNILIILAKQKLHGYMIIQELGFGDKFHAKKVDNTGVYRTLKTLEDRGMVRFEWDLDEPGPAKKTYMITDKGLQCLETWIQTLEDYKNSIESLIKEAKNVFLDRIN